MCAEFPSLSWLEETQEGALSGIRRLVQECVSDLEESGESVPEPLASQKMRKSFSSFPKATISHCMRGLNGAFRKGLVMSGTGRSSRCSTMSTSNNMGNYPYKARRGHVDYIDFAFIP